ISILFQTRSEVSSITDRRTFDLTFVQSSIEFPLCDAPTSTGRPEARAEFATGRNHPKGHGETLCMQPPLNWSSCKRASSTHSIPSDTPFSTQLRNLSP